jgi:hypothetical protein
MHECGGFEYGLGGMYDKYRGANIIYLFRTYFKFINLLLILYTLGCVRPNIIFDTMLNVMQRNVKFNLSQL